MAVEEILILRLIVDISQPVQSFAQLEQRIAQLRQALAAIPKQGTAEFEALAKQISSKLNVSIEDARKKIIDFGNSAEKELKEGEAALKDFND